MPPFRGVGGQINYSITFAIKMPGSEELFPLVDEEGRQKGLAPRSLCHDGRSMLLHPVVHLHLSDSSGRLYLQKRSANKDLLPGYWDTSVGGHISPGEEPGDALRRETLEELGIRSFEYRFNRKYVWQSVRERELVYSFSGTSDEEPLPDSGEIEEGRFWSHNEIRENLGKGIFTPNFEHEYNMLFITTL